MSADCDGRNYVFHAFEFSSPISSCSLAARYLDDMLCSTLSAGADFSEGVIAKTLLQHPDVILLLLVFFISFRALLPVIFLLKKDSCRILPTFFKEIAIGWRINKPEKKPNAKFMK